MRFYLEIVLLIIKGKVKFLNYIDFIIDKKNKIGTKLVYGSPS